MKEKIIEVQKKWGNGIIKMGELSDDKDSLEEFTNNFLHEIYNFEGDQLLFKPSKASEIQFRNTKEKTISYFIAGDDRKCSEDQGFALAKWEKISFENSQIKIINDLGFATGNYCFENESTKIKVEFSFGYIEIDNSIKIFLHHSSIPYKK